MHVLLDQGYYCESQALTEETAMSFSHDFDDGQLAFAAFIRHLDSLHEQNQSTQRKF